MARRPPLPSPNALRHRRQQRTQRLLAIRAVRDALVSLAGVVGRPVRNQAGAEVGVLIDVVARWGGSEPYPPVTGIVVKVGRRLAFVSADQIAELNNHGVRLNSARLDLRDFVRRPGEVTLGRDVLDHQLVDVDGVQVIRAADLYLAVVWDAIRLVGVDVSVQSLVRRLGPRRFRSRPTPEKVIDWAAIQPFGAPVPQVRLRSSHDGLRRLRPGELADLLEDLGRPARQELLAALEPETVADALEEMDPEELGALLRETPPDQAAELLASMEPDEAVDALRDLDEEDRDALLEHMEPEQREDLEELLEYEEDVAGGIMTTNLVVAGLDETVADVRERLREARDHSTDIDAVAVIDLHGLVVDDLSLYELAVAEPGQLVSELISDASPVTVTPGTEVREVASQLIESRRGSVVVVDDDGRPLGRILADDVVDSLTPERGRFHFPRLLQ
jgi:CBS domain-containing protein